MVMMVSKAISHGCYLLVAVVLARSLEVAEFGTFNQVWLVNKSLVFLFALGLPVSVYYFLARLPDAKKKSFILQTIASLAVLALPFAISMYALADSLARYFHNPALASSLRLFAVYPLLTLPTISTDAILIGLGRTRQAALFDIVTTTAMLAAVAAAATLGHRLNLVLQALLAYGVVQSLLAAWLVWRPVRRMPSRFSAADLKAQVAYAAPYGLAALVGALNYQVDKILVALSYPVAVFALYAVAAFEIPLGGVTSVPVVSVIMGELTRRFTSGDIEGFLRLWHQSMLKLALPVFAVAGFLLVVAGPVVVAMYSSKYADSVGLFRIYLLFLALRITVLEQVLAALGDTRFVFKAQAVALLVNVALGYLLMRAVGWFGPAISALFVGYLFGAMVMVRIRRRLNVGFGRLVPWLALGRVALVAVLAAGGAAAVTVLGSNPVWKVGAGFLVFATMYLLGNLWTGAVTAGDLRTVWSSVQMARRWPTGGERARPAAPE
jgi:O-antigen/teichoic acid export membrane protein